MRNEQMLSTSSIKGRMKQDIYIVFFFALLGALSSYLLSNENIGFALAFIGVIYGLIRACNNNIAFFMMNVLAFDFFGLVPNLTVGAGTLHWYDINVLFALIFFIKCLKTKKGTRFGSIFLIYYIFLIIACFQSLNIYGQSIFSTIGTARTTLIYIGFWPIIYLIQREKIKVQDLLEIFDYVCVVAIICYCIQFVGVNLGFDITYLPTKVRWGTRVYINFSFIIVYYFYNLYYLLYEKANVNKRSHGLRLILSIVVIAIVAQSRASILYMAVVSIIAVIISLRPRKILKYTTLAIAVLVTLMLIPTTRDIIISSAIEASSNDEGTIAYRVIETRYYNNLLEGHELFGVGIPNNHASNSIVYSGKTIDWSSKKYGEYYLSDLGAYKIRYQFGIVAFVLYFAYLTYLCFAALKSRSHNPMAFVGLFSCLYLIINSSLLEILTREPFVFMLIVVFAEVGLQSGRLNSEKCC